MKTSHYVEVSVNGGGDSSRRLQRQHSVAASIIDTVHRENSADDTKKDERLGLAFPLLGEDINEAFVYVRIFGSKEALQPVRERLAASLGDEARVWHVRATPVEHNMRAYVRDRSRERLVPGYSERALLHAQSKVMKRVVGGQELIKPPMDSVEREEARFVRCDAASPVSAYLKLRSRSNGNAFSMFVGVIERPNGDPEAIIGTYGLSPKSPLVGVPHF